MRTTIALLALAAAAPAVLAQNFTQGKLGFALGTKLPNGNCKAQADYESDFTAISTQTGSKIVRGYSAADCNFAQNILPAAKSKGFQVILGIWPDTDDGWIPGKAAVLEYAPQFKDQVYGVTVGSEGLYRGSYTADSLLEKINEIKTALPDVKVGTADSWNKFNDGTADPLIKGGVTFILANAFAFWQGHNVGSGAEFTYFDDVQRALGHIQTLTGSLDGFEFWNGETGWPTDGGSDYSDAKAGTANAAQFYKDSVCAMLDWGVNVFYFEAFDES